MEASLLACNMPERRRRRRLIAERMYAVCTAGGHGGRRGREGECRYECRPPSFSLRPSVRPIPVSHETAAARGGGDDDDDDRLNGSVAARRIIQPMCAIASAFSVNGCSAIITIASYIEDSSKTSEAMSNV